MRIIKFLKWCIRAWRSGGKEIMPPWDRYLTYHEILGILYPDAMRHINWNEYFQSDAYLLDDR